MITPIKFENNYSPETLALMWRNSELERTDKYMQIPDYPYKAKLAEYRSQLRNITDHEEFPNIRIEMPLNDKGKPIA